MTNTKSPLVSIGMPVYNGDNYLEEAIESILKQDYPNYELIISDNASTDDTEKICKEYLKNNPQIRYYRFDENKGASKNFSKTFELAKGKYFKWAAHDDKLSPQYISECVKLLEADPELGLCQTYATYINENGEQIGKLEFSQIDFPQKNSYQNYLVFLKRFRYRHDDVIIVNGVFRQNILSKTKLIDSYNSSDLTLLANIVLLTKINIIPDYLFHYRWHDKKSTLANKKNTTYTKWFDPNRKSYNIPLVLWYKEFNNFISRSTLKSHQKLVAYLATFQWLNFRIIKGIRRRVVEIF